MENPPHLMPSPPSILSGFGGAAEEPLVILTDEVGVADPALRTASGIWSLDGDHLVSVESFEHGPAVVLVRSEHVLILVVDLPPIAGLERRRAAVPFAIEERVGEPLGEVHVALGAQLAPNRFVVGVVRHELMRQWVLRLAEAGLERAALVPDALALPVPGPQTWSVDLAAERAMVRAPDGTGFAMPLALLEPAWRAAGEPACIAYGDALQPPMGAPQAALDVEPMARRLLAPALDLRQGPYAPPRRPVDPLWKRIAVVAAIGALAHAGIAAADTLALTRMAAEREAEVRALAATVQPALVLGADLTTTLSELTPDPQQADTGRFLMLLGRTGAALKGVEGGVAWRSVAYNQSLGDLTIAVEADGIARLQRVAQALAAAGLQVQPGSATTDAQGRAVGTFAVTAA
jgi:general secretion pathway protein L